MKSQTKLFILVGFIVFLTGFMSGYHRSFSNVDMYQSSEGNLIDSVNQYASAIMTEVENEYTDMGVKAKIGVTDIKIRGKYALVGLIMEKYDPIMKDSYKSFHITQWQIKDGKWVL